MSTATATAHAEQAAPTASPPEYKPVEVEAAKFIARQYDKAVVVILAWDRVHNRIHSTTYGQEEADKLAAARLGMQLAAAAGGDIASQDAQTHETFLARTQAGWAREREALTDGIREGLDALLGGHKSPSRDMAHRILTDALTKADNLRDIAAAACTTRDEIRSQQRAQPGHADRQAARAAEVQAEKRARRKFAIANAVALEGPEAAGVARRARTLGLYVESTPLTGIVQALRNYAAGRI